jgi:hypothetical protein
LRRSKNAYVPTYPELRAWADGNRALLAAVLFATESAKK